MSQQLRDQLKAYKRKNNIKTPHPDPKRKKKTESLSQRDLEDLMGMNRQTLKRGRGGAYKRKS